MKNEESFSRHARGDARRRLSGQGGGAAGRPRPPIDCGPSPSPAGEKFKSSRRKLDILTGNTYLCPWEICSSHCELIRPHCELTNSHCDLINSHCESENES